MHISPVRRLSEKSLNKQSLRSPETQEAKCPGFVLTSWLWAWVLVVAVYKYWLYIQSFPQCPWSVYPLWLWTGNTGQTTRVQPGHILQGFRIRSTLLSYSYLAFRSDFSQQLEGCLLDPNLSSHAWSQLVSHFVNSSRWCRKDCSWDQQVLSLTLLILGLWEGSLAGHDTTQDTWKRLILNEVFGPVSSLHPRSQLRSSWCKMKAWPKLIMGDARMVPLQGAPSF